MAKSLDKCLEANRDDVTATEAKNLRCRPYIYKHFQPFCNSQRRLADVGDKCENRYDERREVAARRLLHSILLAVLLCFLNMKRKSAFVTTRPTLRASSITPTILCTSSKRESSSCSRS